MGTVDLRDADATCGAKAWRLGMMLRAGLPVPPGAVVVPPSPGGGLLDGLDRGLLDRPVAVRSSAVAEDGDLASFAGQLATELGVRGHDAVADAVERCATSGRSARATVYAERVGSVLPERVPVIVHQLVDADASLGRAAATLVGRPVDVEWAVADGRAWLLQVRPVTAPPPQPPGTTAPDGTGVPLVRGTGAGRGTATGPARVVRDVDGFGSVRPGDVLVCRTTDPAWTPLFGVVAAVVTETGGILSHAAIVGREVGIPVVVGAARATAVVTDGSAVHVDGVAGTVSPSTPGAGEQR